MKSLLVIYNPRSSRFSEVKTEVLGHLKNLKGFIVGKYEIEPTDVDQNSKKLAKLLKDDDLVISAGGDATSTIAVNAIMKSNKDVIFSALPFGNFNDLARTLGLETLDEVLKNYHNPKNFYPLEIFVDGQFFRYATCYVTIGMTAEAVKIYDDPKVRKKLKTSSGCSIGSYLSLASWYFKNRHSENFLPEFKLNGELKSPKTSDYAAVNGRYMARVMNGREDYLDSDFFRSETDQLTSFPRLTSLMSKSIFNHIPGERTKLDHIEFISPATVELQAEGEYKKFEDIKIIEIRKAKQCLKVITK